MEVRSLYRLEDHPSLRQEQAVYAYRPHCVENAIRYFNENLDAKVLYAVKTNPDSVVLEQLYASGLRRFECASLDEVRLIKGLFIDLDFGHIAKP